MRCVTTCTRTRMRFSGAESSGVSPAFPLGGRRNMRTLVHLVVGQNQIRLRVSDAPMPPPLKKKKKIRQKSLHPTTTDIHTKNTPIVLTHNIILEFKSASKDPHG